VREDRRVLLLADLARTSADVAAAPGRTAKVEHLATLLRRATPEEAPVAVAYLSGDLRQRRTGLGWAALRELPPAAPTPTLSLLAVDAAFDRLAGLAGPGSTTARRAGLTALLTAATAAEQRLLAGLVSGELRQGAQEGLVLTAVARAAGLPEPEVRTAAALAGSLPEVAAAALTGGSAALARFRLQVGRPLQPMLAQTAGSVAEGLGLVGPEAAVEWKLDGIRVQVHRSGSDVAVFTRSLDDVTDRLPDVVSAALTLPVRAAVLDGEALVLRPDGRPAPFQVTGSRVGRRVDVATARTQTPLTLFLFDALHVDGTDLLALPGAARAGALEAVTPPALRVPRLVTAVPEAAAGFLDGALAREHEGVVVKSLAAPYTAGRRGPGWVKVKPVHTLDLVVVAAEWGHGRRQGRLSNLHLAARGPTGDFVMLGKTFKGLTDATLAWQTEQLLALAVTRTEHIVTVRPELVVEVAFDGVQTSPRYPGGLALRFARVVRYRPDKAAAEADTVDAVRALHRGS
jgi:DNA ligase-1